MRVASIVDTSSHMLLERMTSPVRKILAIYLKDRTYKSCPHCPVCMHSCSSLADQKLFSLPSLSFLSTIYYCLANIQDITCPHVHEGSS